MSKRKRILLILAVLATLVLAIIAVVTAIRLQQIGTEPVAPSVPKSKPKASAANQCHQVWTITSAGGGCWGTGGQADTGCLYGGKLTFGTASCGSNVECAIPIGSPASCSADGTGVCYTGSPTTFSAMSSDNVCEETSCSGITGACTWYATCPAGPTATPTTVPGALSCHADAYKGKIIYQNDPSNTPGVYNLDQSNVLVWGPDIVHGGGIVNPGDILVYHLPVKNTGTTSTSGQFVDQLDPKLDFMDLSQGCSFTTATRTVTCTVTSLPAGQSISNLSFRVKVKDNAAEGAALNNIATLSVGGVTADTCQANMTVGSNDLTCHFDTYDGKRMYSNDASNTPGVYTLTTENRLNNGATVNPGDIIVYSVPIKNTGTTTSSGKLVDQLDPRLDFMDARSGTNCAFVAATRTVVCDPLQLGAGGATGQSFRVKVKSGAAGGALNNTATLSVGLVTADTCAANLVLPGPTATPTPTGEPTATPTPGPSATPTPGVILACTDLDLPGGTSRKQNESISFVCKGDPSAQVTQCRFRFGDGSAEVFEDDCNVIKQYSSLGNYSTSCEVRDTSGNWRAASACEATVQIVSGPTNTPAPGATAYPTNQQSTPRPSATPTTVLAEGPTAIPTVPQQQLPSAGGIGQTIGVIVGGIGVILLGLLMLL